jgi:hypothetical protein
VCGIKARSAMGYVRLSLQVDACDKARRQSRLRCMGPERSFAADLARRTIFRYGADGHRDRAGSRPDRRHCALTSRRLWHARGPGHGSSGGGRRRSWPGSTRWRLPSPLRAARHRRAHSALTPARSHIRRGLGAKRSGSTTACCGQALGWTSGARAATAGSGMTVTSQSYTAPQDPLEYGGPRVTRASGSDPNPRIAR